MVAAKKDEFLRERLPPPPQDVVYSQRPATVAKQEAPDPDLNWARVQISHSHLSMHPKEEEGPVQVEPSPHLSSGEPEAEKSLDEAPPAAPVGMEPSVASRCLQANRAPSPSTSESFTGSFAETGALSTSGSLSRLPPECLRRIALPTPPSPQTLLEAQGPRTPEFRAPRETRTHGVADVSGASRSELSRAAVPRSTGRLPMVPLLLLGQPRPSAETTTGPGREC